MMGVKCRRETFSSSNFIPSKKNSGHVSKTCHKTPLFFVYLAGCIPGHLFVWMKKELLKTCRTKRAKALPEQQLGTVCRDLSALVLLEPQKLLHRSQDCTDV